MDCLKELSHLQAENQKYNEVIEKAAKDLGEARLTIVEENQLDDGICGFAEPCLVQKIYVMQAVPKAIMTV